MTCEACQTPLAVGATTCERCGKRTEIEAASLPARSATRRVARPQPIIGRGEELRLLRARWDQAKAGHGGVVLLSGEAGIGKTRLSRDLEQRGNQDGALVVRLHGSAQNTNSDLFPLLNNLYRAAKVRRAEHVATRYAKLAALFAQTLAPHQPPAKLIRSLAAALGSAASPDIDLPRLLQRRSTALTELLDGTTELAAIVPILLCIDDAQWLDPSTVEVLGRLVERCHSHRILIVVNALRDFQPGWIGAPQTTLIIPRRLNTADAEALARQAAEPMELSDSQLRTIVQRSEGVPVYIEELTREVMMGPSASASARPASLQAVLRARLDRLGPAKRLAQVASALGRRFSHEIASVVWDGDEADLANRLNDLITAEFLQPTPISRGAIYSFRHALLHEAAYASLSDALRISLHTRIVEALRVRAHAFVADQPEVVAYHSAQADLTATAAAYWLDAGKASAARGSVLEAVNYFKLGLAAVATCKDPERRKVEFELNLNLGPALMALEGYASDTALAAFQRAHDRLDLSRSSMEKIHVLLGLFNGHFGRGELARAFAVARQANEALAVGYGGYPVLLGQTLCMMGRFNEAQKCLRHALDSYDPTLDSNSGLFCSADVVATSFLAKTRFSLGELQSSTELTQSALSMARQQGHPIALAIAHLGVLFLATEAGHLDRARAIADEALDHAVKHHLGNYVLWVSFHRAALTAGKDPEAALAAMTGILADATAAGTKMFRSAQLGLIGATHGRLGRYGPALAAIDEGITTAHATLGLEILPALHRLRAKTLAAMTLRTEAIGDVETALMIARSQSARTEELRSATLLTQLVEGSERHVYAHQQLSQIYSEFDASLDFADLRHAARTLAAPR